MSVQKPGIQDLESQTPRDIYASRVGAVEIGVIVDGTNGADGGATNTYDWRAGIFMAIVTSTSEWLPCKRTTVAGDTESSSAVDNETVINVDSALAFIVGDTITAGVHTSLVITAVDYTNNEITVDNNVNLVDGDDVFATTPAGSQTARGILAAGVRARNAKNTAAADVQALVSIAGVIDTDMLLHDATAIRADTAAKLGGFQFDDDHGSFA
jgi:hypothetical protein